MSSSLKRFSINITLENILNFKTYIFTIDVVYLLYANNYIFLKSLKLFLINNFLFVTFFNEIPLCYCQTKSIIFTRSIY